LKERGKQTLAKKDLQKTEEKSCQTRGKKEEKKRGAQSKELKSEKREEGKERGARMRGMNIKMRFESVKGRRILEPKPHSRRKKGKKKKGA